MRSMYAYAATGLQPGVHRGLPSDGLTLVLSLEEPLRTAPSEQAWDEGVRDAQWVSLGGLHTRAAMVEQPGRWAGIQLQLHPLGLRSLLQARDRHFVGVGVREAHAGQLHRHRPGG